MMPGGAAALAMMDAVFGETVTYTGAGLIAQPIVVIWSDTAGAPFQGVGNTTRMVTVEVRRARLPQRPAVSDRILRGTTAWKPIEALERDDIDAWDLTLEKVG